MLYRRVTEDDDDTRAARPVPGRPPSPYSSNLSYIRSEFDARRAHGPEVICEFLLDTITTSCDQTFRHYALHGIVDDVLNMIRTPSPLDDGSVYNFFRSVLYDDVRVACGLAPILVSKPITLESLRLSDMIAQRDDTRDLISDLSFLRRIAMHMEDIESDEIMFEVACQFNIRFIDEPLLIDDTIRACLRRIRRRDGLFDLSTSFVSRCFDNTATAAERHVDGVCELRHIGWPVSLGSIVRRMVVDTTSVEFVVRLRRLHGAMPAFMDASRAHARSVTSWFKVYAFLDGCERSMRQPARTREVCPITLEEMRDPVVASDGHTYERSAIVEYMVRTGMRSPITRVDITYHLISNRVLLTA